MGRYISTCVMVCMFYIPSVFLTTSVLSYNAWDSSFNSSSATKDFQTTSNSMGAAGAYAGDLLVQFFGFAGVLPGVLLIFRAQQFPNFIKRIYVPCSLCVTASVAGILSKLVPEAVEKYNYGGFVGDKLSEFSLTVLIAVLAVASCCTVGWSGTWFLARIVVNRLSSLRLKVSKYRMSKTRDRRIDPGIADVAEYFVNESQQQWQRGAVTSGYRVEAGDDRIVHSPKKDEERPGDTHLSDRVVRGFDSNKAISVFFPEKRDEGERCREQRPTVAQSWTNPMMRDMGDTDEDDDEGGDARISEFAKEYGDDLVAETVHPRQQMGSNLHRETSEFAEELYEGAPCDEDSEGDQYCEGEDDFDYEERTSSETHTYGKDEPEEEEYDDESYGSEGENYDDEFDDGEGADSYLTEQSEQDDEDSWGEMKNIELPHVDLLSRPPQENRADTECEYKDESEELYSVLKDFGVLGKIIAVRYGPVVTMYEFEPSAGTKSSRIIGLADDIARSMSALSTRISVVPGRNILGIELPNRKREIVVLRDLIESSEYRDLELRLPIILGKGIDGDPVVGDLTKMPHLLIAGTTGSGKSVGINTMILSLLYRLTPDQCRMIMIDPKVLELSVYDNIPHLLTPVVTEAKKAVAVLKWVVAEMEERYRMMSAVGVRNITGYNEKISIAASRGEVYERVVQTGFDRTTGAAIFSKKKVKNVPLPYIVVIVDEMADLMIVSGKEIESSIQRLSQMARAAGIHIIMATQRPSVDVITGVIKANFPTRISFAVTSKIDSRTILGEQGAEQLLGMGDMLYMVAGGKIRRIHGAFVSDSDVQDVVNHLREQGEPRYVHEITKLLDHNDDIDIEDFDDREDSLYERAVALVLRDRKTSVSYVQRQLRIGYNRAANLVERMEREGIITPAGHMGKREIVG
ncbi:DNA translocase FtsK [Anaplasma platys]|uniref:DNA translocase FtsK n=1 Tax=Anaplasma platys TaxID=949 RepID=A0A858PYU6_9RICK|nr:DNA translocase FtsK 4TM domain-containing protein [Anaplasma platys]QJC27749.1 DNA translocase FtsK [Anaplasma platys]